MTRDAHRGTTAGGRRACVATASATAPTHQESRTTTQADLPGPDIVRRVRFRERQPIRASDLSEEQAHLVSMRRRHSIGGHGWGIVDGLELTLDGGALVLQPGVAVDGYGRELIVPEPTPLGNDIRAQLGSTVFDAWLLYCRLEATRPQRGRRECDPGQHSRCEEVAYVRLTAVAESAHPVVARRPPDVEAADADFPPNRTPPDGSDRPWPVYLGRVTLRDGAPPTIDPAGRPYATLRGERIVAPSGRADLQVGGELVGDHRRFVVRTGEPGATTERLVVDRDGTTTISGDTIVRGDAPTRGGNSGDVAACEGNLTVAESNGDAHGIQFRPLAPPTAPAPWRVYRTALGERPTTRELRFEIGHPGEKGDPTAYRLAIGHAPPRRADAAAAEEPDPFKACLTVDADCTVTIAGTLRVDGHIIMGPIPPDPSDPRFRQELSEQWAAGLNDGLGTISQYGGVLEATVTAQRVPTNRFEVTVEVRNAGPSRLTNVQAHADINFDQRGGLLARIGTADLSLDPGKAGKLSQQFTIPPRRQRAVISVVVASFGPAFNVIYAMTSTELELRQKR